MKYIVFLFFFLFAILNSGGEDETQNVGNVVKVYDVYFPVDWRDIRPNQKALSRRACIEGYLGFDGFGDFPRIILWETDEARRQQMTFRGILVQSESASPLINKRFGAGADNWKVLEGMFVSIEGLLNIEPSESRHLFIGGLNSIKSIAVKNNGMVLLDIR